MSVFHYAAVSLIQENFLLLDGVSCRSVSISINYNQTKPSAAQILTEYKTQGIQP